MTDSPLRAIIITDGKRGHENQSRVIARMLGISEPLRMLLRPQFKEGGWTELMLRLRLRLRGPQSFSRAAAGDLVRTMLKPEQPEAFRELVDEIAAARVAGGVGADLVSARDLGPVDGPNMFGPYAEGTGAQPCAPTGRRADKRPHMRSFSGGDKPHHY